MESLFANISMYETLRLILVGSFRICLQERLYLMLMAKRHVSRHDAYCATKDVEVLGHESPNLRNSKIFPCSLLYIRLHCV